MAKRGLGKGLDAIFGEPVLEQVQEKKEFTTLKITEIETNPEQPRKNFDPEQLKMLSESIKTHGVIQPIIVSPKDNGFYEIIAGERRWRAAKMAGLKTIPAIIRDYDEEQTMEVALVENLQREDLNPIEEAKGYRDLALKFGLTQEQISEKIGKSRSYVTNTMRLLSLSDGIQKKVISGELSSGHARTLLAVLDEEKREELAMRAIEEQLSVRELERLVSQKKKRETPKKEKIFEAEFRAIEDELSRRMGTRVKIINGAKKGKIEIEYYGNDDLNRILSIIDRKFAAQN